MEEDQWVGACQPQAAGGMRHGDVAPRGIAPRPAGVVASEEFLVADRAVSASMHRPIARPKPIVNEGLYRISRENVPRTTHRKIIIRNS